MFLSTLLSFFLHTLSFTPLLPLLLTPIQLTPSSNSFSSGLILMWLLSLSSYSSPFFLLCFSFALSLFFLKNRPLMKLNSLVGSFFGVCVCARIGVWRYVSWLDWLEWRSKAVSKLCVCARRRMHLLTSKRKTALSIASQELIKPSEKKAVIHTDLLASSLHVPLSLFNKLSHASCSRLTKWKCQLLFMSTF